MLTRCPHCDATFRVTEAHLNAAKGKVRCGACLNIFNALEHLTPSPDKAAAPGPDEPAQPALPEESSSAPTGQEPVSEDTRPAPETQPTEPETANTEPADSMTEAADDASSWLQPETDEQANTQSFGGDEPTEAELLAELEAALREHPATESADEELAPDYQDFSLDSLLEEDEELKNALGDLNLDSELQAYQQLDEQALSAAEAELDAILAETPLDEHLEPESAPDTALLEDNEEFLFQDNPDEDKEENYYAGGLIPDDELSDSFKDLDKPAFATSQFGDMADDEEPQSDESWAEEMLDELEANRAEPEVAPEPQLSASPTQPEPEPEPAPSQEPLFAATSTYDRLSPEPIALSESEPRGRGLRTLGWLLANSLLLIALLGQLAWFHQDKLAHHEQLRPLYQTLCNWIGCELAPLQDLSKIRSRHLSVHEHPSIANALVINLVMVNEAPFDQPLPRLSFQFSDLNGTVVAQRIFTPAEYLSGEARDLQRLPANRPIQIALEILDPGAQHRNYVIDFLPPLPQSG